MRTLLFMSLTLFLVSCLESNPQPAPGNTGDPEDPANKVGTDAGEGQSPLEDDAVWDGAVDRNGADARPEPSDLASEITDAVLDGEINYVGPDGNSGESWFPDEDGTPELASDPVDVEEDGPTADAHEAQDEQSVDVVIGDSQLRGGGTYFGECFGACKMDVTVDGDQVNFVAGNWDDTIYVDNDGTLTAAGLAKSKELAAALVGVELEEVYGCPDCADGGGAYVLLRRNGVDSKHDYPFGQPFTALTGCDDFVTELKTALAGCQSTDNIIVGDDCGPLG